MLSFATQRIAYLLLVASLASPAFAAAPASSDTARTNETAPGVATDDGATMLAQWTPNCRGCRR
jgi:hypothetical protein